MKAKERQIALRAVRVLWRFRLRSGLLMLSAALGVAGVVCSVNYGASGTKQVLGQIRSMGTNVLIVTPAQSRAVAGRARTGSAVTTLVERDYNWIKRDLRTRTRSSTLVTQSFWIKAGDLSKNAPVVGSEPDYFAIKDWRVATGEVFGTAEERTAMRVALLGHAVATDLFGTSSPVGARIMINRVPFTVLGVLEERGQGLDLGNEDDRVYVPLNTAMHRLMNLDYYSSIVVEIDSLTNMDESAAQVRSMLRQLHHIRPNQADDFQVQNQKSLLDTQIAAANHLNLFLRWIGALALTVSGMGIVAITWISVKERTQEMGTRRALGATAADIFLQTACESDAVAIVGGFLGISIAWPASRVISNSAGLPFVFNWKTCLVAFIAATLLNLLFSLLPARKAAAVSPVEALRYQ